MRDNLQRIVLIVWIFCSAYEKAYMLLSPYLLRAYNYNYIIKGFGKYRPTDQQTT